MKGDSLMGSAYTPKKYNPHIIPLNKCLQETELDAAYWKV